MKSWIRHGETQPPIEAPLVCSYIFSPSVNTLMVARLHKSLRISGGIVDNGSGSLVYRSIAMSIASSMGTEGKRSTTSREYIVQLVFPLTTLSVSTLMISYLNTLTPI